MATTWILVAENDNARILKADTRIGPLQELDHLQHTPARVQEQQLISDYSERYFDNGGRVRNLVEAAVTPRQQQLISFVEQVATHLDKAYSRDEFSQLIIIAAPVFLGLLRKKLSNRAVAAVVMQMDRNLGHHTVEEIRRHLPDHLPVLT